MPMLSQELKDQIDGIKPAAEGKQSAETQAIGGYEARQVAIEMAKQKDIMDRTSAEKALVMEGYIMNLRSVYEAMSDDNPHAPGLLAVIQGLTTDAVSLAAASNDPVV